MSESYMTADEAAELEGLVKMSAAQVMRLRRYHALKEKRDAAQAQMDELRDEFRGELETDGNQGLLHNGKVVVRRSEVSSPRIDTAGLKKKYPEIAAELILVTHSVRMTIL